MEEQLIVVNKLITPFEEVFSSLLYMGLTPEILA